MNRDLLSLYEPSGHSDPVTIISVPLELGSDVRGLSETPEYLKRNGLERMFSTIGREISEHITIACPKERGETMAGTMKHAEEIAVVAGRTKAAVERALKRRDQVLAIGGDHSVAFGTAAGALARYRRLGVIYIDAHPDAHTHETTISGNVHGMVASAMMGHGHRLLTSIAPHPVSPADFLFIGLKDFDEAEICYIREHGIPAVTALEIATHSLAGAVRAIEALAERVEAVWVSMDMDSIDEECAPGVAMSTPGGLTRREVLSLAHHIGRRCRVAGMDISEMVPAKDKEGKTAALALELIARFFGHEYNWYRAYMEHYRATNIAQEPQTIVIKR